MATGLQLAHNNVLQEAFADGFQSFVNSVDYKLTATSTLPLASGKFYSSITNRAPIVDISKDLKVSLGVERIMVQTVQPLTGETGPNGELVFGTANDTQGLIRFVGAWSSSTDTVGARAVTVVPGSYVEITFYGTGLNMLHDYDNAANDVRVSIDGQTEGSNIAVNGSGVLSGKSYHPGSIKPIVKDLPLGVHTAKIRLAAGNWFVPGGFEVINQTLSLNVNAGSAYIDGVKVGLSSPQTLSYNSAFDSGTLGSRGGRALVYLKKDGSFGKSVTPVNSATAYLTSTDHSNEEVVRIHHFREFGSGRTDDFSRIVTGAAVSNYSFTLDDGTTSISGSLVGVYNTASGQSEGIGFGGGGFITVTFVGCGLDIYETTNATPGTTANIYVDGVSVGTISQIVGSRYRKIVSGLPYGTHTVKIVSVNMTDYILSRVAVYQPKKPSLPAEAIELADYNVMATYVADTVNGNLDTISTGVLHKQCVRECVYVGSGWSYTAASPNVIGGAFVSSATSGNYVEYTFFGTGVEIVASGGNLNIKLNGSNYTGAATALGTGSSWTAGTSTWVGASVNGAKLQIIGLTLGLYTIRVTLNTTASYFHHGFQIITPLHSHKPNLYGDIQNSLLVGSCAISDNRQLTPIKNALQEKKAWAQAVGIVSGPTSTTATAIPLADMSVTIKTSGSPIRIAYAVNVSCSVVPGNVITYIYLNGLQVGTSKLASLPTAGYSDLLCDNIVVPVGAGTHKIDIYWSNQGGGTATSWTTGRTLLVKEE